MYLRDSRLCFRPEWTQGTPADYRNRHWCPARSRLSPNCGAVTDRDLDFRGGGDGCLCHGAPSAIRYRLRGVRVRPHRDAGSERRKLGHYARFPRLGDPDRRSAWPDRYNDSLATSNDSRALIVPPNMSISRSRYHCKQAAEQPSDLAKIRAVVEMEHNDRERHQDGPENCLSDA